MLALLSQSLSHEMPLSFDQITSAQNSSFTLSSVVPLTSKSTILSYAQGETSLTKQSMY